MHAADVYDYAIVRVVPRVEREEFINAGVILSCQRTGFLQAAMALDEARLLAMERHEPSVPDIVAVGPDEDRLALPASVQSRLASTEILQQPALVAVAVTAPALPRQVSEAAPVLALAASIVPVPAPAVVSAAAADPSPAAPQRCRCSSRCC